MKYPEPQFERLLTPGEVAAAFRVDVKNLYRWERSGVLVPSLRTPGGHRRYRESVILALLNPPRPS